jgi:endonuclease VIII
MPEGDTIRRAADVLRGSLLGETIVDARGRAGVARMERLVGSRVVEVRSLGKHLLIAFDVGLTLHTHLGMHGAWHRYRDGERWRRRRDAAVAILRTSRAAAVCFDAAIIELIETRAVPIHPGLSALGPDLLAPDLDPAAVVSRLLSPVRATRPVAEVLLDQTAVAGIGNVHRCEVLFLARVDPFRSMGTLRPDDIEDLLRRAATLLRANVGGGRRATVPRPGERGAAAVQDLAAGGLVPWSGTGLGHDGLGAAAHWHGLWVYRRTGRPCRRCGTAIRSVAMGEPLRRLYWCPTCQAPDIDAGAERARGPAGGVPGGR